MISEVQRKCHWGVESVYLEALKIHMHGSYSNWTNQLSSSPSTPLLDLLLQECNVPQMYPLIFSAPRFCRTTKVEVESEK